MKAENTESLRRCGFSLVEVAIAIGIVSFALLSCVGLNVVSLSSFSDARSVEVSARIFRGILNEAQVSDFADIDALDGIRSYNSEGLPLDDGTDPTVVYIANISVEKASIAGEEMDADAIARTLVVKVYAHAKQEANALLSTRCAMIGNRMKGAK